MIPSIRIKVSADAYPLAVDLIGDLMGDGRTRLGPAPGSRCEEKIAGFYLIAHRLRCGGIDVRQVGLKRGRVE